MSIEKIEITRASAYKIKEKSGILGMVYWEGTVKEEQSWPKMQLIPVFRSYRTRG
jgi:hypothetical protein